MAGRSRLLFGTALLTLIAGSSMSLAQTGRPWVDPPPASGAPAPAPSQSPAPAQPAVPKPVSTLPSKAPAVQPAQSGKEKASTKVETANAPADEKPAVKSKPKKKVVTERKSRSSARQARKSSRAQVAERRGLSRAEQRRISRYEMIQEGLDSGLVVMNMRTIELPDGRRIRVLTRPAPGALSEMLAEPY